MTDVQSLIQWLETLDPTSGVAIDDGGLTLVELDGNNQETEEYFEIGGIPEDGD